MDTNLAEFKKKEKKIIFLRLQLAKKDEEKENRSAIFDNLYYF